MSGRSRFGHGTWRTRGAGTKVGAARVRERAPARARTSPLDFLKRRRRLRRPCACHGRGGAASARAVSARGTSRPSRLGTEGHRGWRQRAFWRRRVRAGKCLDRHAPSCAARTLGHSARLCPRDASASAPRVVCRKRQKMKKMRRRHEPNRVRQVGTCAARSKKN